MAIIYRLRYSDGDQFREENFEHKKDAATRFDQLLGDDDVNNLELYRQELMRPSLATILRILNGEPYAINQRMILTGKITKRN